MWPNWAQKFLPKYKKNRRERSHEALPTGDDALRFNASPRRTVINGGKEVETARSDQGIG